MPDETEREVIDGFLSWWKQIIDEPAALFAVVPDNRCGGFRDVRYRPILHAFGVRRPQPPPE